MSRYDDAYFSKRSACALESARVIVPIVLRYVKPLRVLDVGCAQGEWLRAFQEQGVAHICGLDGNYVDQSKLLIPKSSFRAVDLDHLSEIDATYDLAVCVEVAEHLLPASNGNLVANLVKAAPLILFSAAVPYQGGTGHQNEQWPRYWRLAFAEHRYLRLDVIRPVIWQDPRVGWWYQQNVFLFASHEVVARSEVLRQAAHSRPGPQLELVNESSLDLLTSFRGLLRELPGATRRMIRNHLHHRGVVRKKPPQDREIPDA